MKPVDDFLNEPLVICPIHNHIYFKHTSVSPDGAVKSLSQAASLISLLVSRTTSSRSSAFAAWYRGKAVRRIWTYSGFAHFMVNCKFGWFEVIWWQVVAIGVLAERKSSTTHVILLFDPFPHLVRQPKALKLSLHTSNNSNKNKNKQNIEIQSTEIQIK